MYKLLTTFHEEFTYRIVEGKDIEITFTVQIQVTPNDNKKRINGNLVHCWQNN